MFEDKTVEKLLGSMLSYVVDRNPDLDTREGSIIYTALAPIALELETAYHEMDMILDETFISTASKEYLIKHGDQLGLELKDAECGQYEGLFDVDVPIGKRFNCDKFNYTVVDKIANPTASSPYYRLKLVCETPGTEPNDCLGDLTPIDFVQNLTYSKLSKMISGGADEEETESYRYRLQVHAKNPPLDGNVAQYNEWLDELDGIGKYKVDSCWNGVNTVKLTITNAKNKAADSTLIEEIQDYFDPPSSDINDDSTDSTYPQGRGMGNGKAPIGAIVTVDTVTEATVTITCQLKLKEGYSNAIGVKEAVTEYLDSITLDKNAVGYLPISAEIYNAESVEDVAGLVITVTHYDGTDVIMDIDADDFISSVTLDENEIPVFDAVNSDWGI